MKRSTSAEHETPKKRRKSRVPYSSSPAQGHRTPKPPRSKEAKASSHELQKVLQSHKAESARVPSSAPHALLEPAAQLLETPPATSPPESLVSVMQKIPPSSGSVEMDLSDGEETPGEKKTAADRAATPREGQDETSDKGISAKKEEPAPEKNATEPKTPIIDLESAVTETPEPKTTEPADAKAAVVVEIMASPRQGTGASADDAMEIDPTSPSEQLKHEHQKSQARGDQDMPDHMSGTVVSSQWLLAKLNQLSAATLDADRIGIQQELLAMQASVAQLPRAVLTPPALPHRPGRSSSSTSSMQRLKLMEQLIKPQLAGSGFPWRGYKAKLAALCAGNEIHNADYRQRLAMVKEIIYLPEEMNLVRGGSAERIECAVRVCAMATEVLGRDGEVMVPKEEMEMAAWMAAWMAGELQDVAWKAKVTGAWRKYWPEPTTNTVMLD
ncbi:hypothetical protein CCM_05088 [Cordyceps militaris CM01]|uniref:Uncharacterized protein n=1 Tax=Cordyceps militaris (strain CM01) TaxID=983644 RepID=G3JHS6_CORMM|nr:uncharacterized protein CCM_05088 [Cordyceps militaris CM01]EGX90932.1 hypothetical protein CCM_05088 [Cordyceps militaris CM01]